MNHLATFFIIIKNTTAIFFHVQTVILLFSTVINYLNYAVLVHQLLVLNCIN